MSSNYSIQNQNLYQTSVVETKKTENTTTAKNIDVTEAISADNTSFSNSSDVASKTTKRTEEELNNTLKALCTKYGIDLKDVKSLLAEISDCNEEELLNKADEEITKEVKIIITACEDCRQKDGKVDIEEVGQLAKTYSNIIQKGQTIDNYKNDLNKLYNRVNETCQKYGIEVKDLQNQNILSKIAGCSEQNLLTKSSKDLNDIADSFEAAVIRCSKNGKVDLEEVAKLANKYNVALKTGWNSIKQYQNYDDKAAKSTLTKRLIDTGCLPKNCDITKLSESEIATAVDKFFNKILLGNDIDNLPKEKKNQKYKAQLQTFGRLLNNTPDEEKAIFKQAVVSLVAQNRAKGLEALVESFSDDSLRTNFTSQMGVDYMQKIATTKDRDGNVPEISDITEATAVVVKNQTEEARIKFHGDFQKQAEEFFSKNKETLDRIAEKENNGETLTEEEKELKIQRDNFFKAVASGEIIGTAENTIISEQFKTKFLNVMVNDNKKLPVYEDIKNEINKYLENHPETNTNIGNIISKTYNDVENGVVVQREQYYTSDNNSSSHTTSNDNQRVTLAKTTDIGFQISDKKPNNTTSATIASIYNTTVNSEEETQAISKDITQYDGLDNGYSLFKNAVGGFTALQETLNKSSKVSMSFLTKAIIEYKTVYRGTQDRILKSGLSISGLSLALDNTFAGTFDKMGSHVILDSKKASDMFAEKSEEKLDNNNKREIA